MFLHDYDVFGFDLDNCVAEYLVEKMTPLMVESHLQDLFENFGYPSDLVCGLNWEFYGKVSKSFALTNTVWDINSGLILELFDDKKINRALKGF